MSLIDRILYEQTNHEDDMILIASSEDYVEESSYQDDNKKGGLKVFIHTREGLYVPHLHITSSNTKFKETCIKLGICEYFKHGTHKGELTNAQAEIVDSILRAPNKKIPGITNYDDAIATWKRSHSTWMNYDTSAWLDNPQPDYSEINKRDN